MKALDDLMKRLEHNKKLYAGYPPNTQFDYSELFGILEYPTNNLGDPFQLRSPFSTHEFECEVIRWFLRLYDGGPTGWGYVTSGSTEGILFGMWNGREKLKNPVVYFSSHAHYCVVKLARLLNLEYRIIKSEKYGEIDYEDFEQNLVVDRDALVLATLGSTMTSSIDDVGKLIQKLKTKNIHYYVHADAAFDGMILPFVETAMPYRLTDGIDSISISGHKIIGSPTPCGVVLTENQYASEMDEISYVKNRDATILSSRNGFNVLVLWYAIKKYRREGFKNLIDTCINEAEKFCNLLKQNSIQAHRFKHSITIALENAPKELYKKWRVPCDNTFTTLTALPKLTEAMVKEIIMDIKYYDKHSEFRPDSADLLLPCMTEDIILSD